jgi:hypothetical protein
LGLPLARTGLAYVEPERELSPGRFHIAVRKEQPLDNPWLLLRQRPAARDSVPLAPARQEHRGGGEAYGSDVICVNTGLGVAVHPARVSLATALFTEYSQQHFMRNVVETPFDVSFNKPLHSRPAALYSAERGVATTIRTEPVGVG